MTKSTKQTSSRVTQEIIEMADDMHRIGIMDAKTHRQITVRHLGRDLPSHSRPDYRRSNTRGEGTGKPQSGRTCPLSERNCRLRLSIRAGNQRSEGPTPHPAEC